MDISDMLFILQLFNLNFVPFLLLIVSCSLAIIQHLRLDYCENFKLAWEKTIDKLKWKAFFFNIVNTLVSISNHLVI